ncbi:MAG: tetratricopeptide repeat protein [Planctomycetaceae bacterium]|nr:MAG: tetratricopeptide repeat protein [Planctomycetaceae bacterium]
MPEDLELIKLRAVQLLQQLTPESLHAAKEKLQQVIKLEPTSVDAHLGLIGIAMKQDDYAGARDYAIRACGSNPDNPALLAARGRAELALENVEMAVQLARLGLARDPNSAEAGDLLVEAALKGNDRRLLDEAGTLAETWVRRDPADVDILIARARVLTSLGTPQKAIPELEAYCRTNQGSASVPACVMLADLYRLSGDVDKAGQKIDQAESREPNNQRVIHARFLWLLAQKRFTDLQGISSAYISAEEQDPMMVLMAGSTLAASSSMTLKKEGLLLLEHAVTLSPTSAKARLSLAFALYQAGEVERAEQMYRQLLSQHPANIQALNDLAWILQAHDRDYAAALELVNTGLRLARDEPHLLDTRGTILANMQDRLAEARNDFQRLTALSPSGSREKARAFLKLGRICVKLNDLTAAKRHLDEALKIDKETNVFTPAERSEISNILLGRDPMAVL